MSDDRTANSNLYDEINERRAARGLFTMSEHNLRLYVNVIVGLAVDILGTTPSHEQVIGLAERNVSVLEAERFCQEVAEEAARRE